MRARVRELKFPRRSRRSEKFEIGEEEEEALLQVAAASSVSLVSSNSFAGIGLRRKLCRERVRHDAMRVSLGLFATQSYDVYTHTYVRMRQAVQMMINNDADQSSEQKEQIARGVLLDSIRETVRTQPAPPALPSAGKREEKT